MKKGLIDTDRSKPIEKNDEQQEMRNAFNDFKNALRGLKESTDEMVDEFAQLNQVAKVNGGKVPDVNEILKKVFDGQDGEE